MTNDKFYSAEGTCPPLADGAAPSRDAEDPRSRLLNPSLTNVLFMALHARPNTGEALPELASARLTALPSLPGTCALERFP